MDGDDEDGLAAEAELSDERLAAGRPGLARGGDPARRDRQCRAPTGPGHLDRSRRVATRAVDELQVAIEPVEEDLADVASRLPAVGPVLRVCLLYTSRCV